MKRVMSFLLLFSLLLQPCIAKAQEEAAPSPLDARKTMGTILLAGLVGGVLGLSTLSFYEHPEDNIRNITFGAGGGMIIAALYITLDIAKTPPASLTGESEETTSYIVPQFDGKNVGLFASLRF